MRLIDADVLKKEIHMSYSDDLCILPKIDEQPTVKPSVNPLNVLESLLYSLKSKHMAEDMWEPVSKYCERYSAILKAVNVLEELQKESGGKRK